MTVVELASALGLTLAGFAGLIKASNCKRVECGIRGLVCEKEMVAIEAPVNHDIKTTGDAAPDLS
jgi:hypothetical protein